MRFLLIAIALVLLTGCSAQFDQVGRAVDKNARSLDVIQPEQQLLRQEVAAITAVTEGLQGADEQTQQRLLARLGQINGKLDQLKMQLADNNEFMRSVSARVDLLTTKLGIATLGDYKETPTTDDSIVVLPEEGKSIFQAAMSDRGKGDYEFAVAGFTEFLTKYPDSELSDNALFRLGELAWLDKDEESALAYYARLLDQFPDSELRADTLLKTFSMLTESGNSDAAGRYLQQLEDEFPDSEQVGLAKAAVN
ncbi:tetratricopeptide repeat protein [bacterium]|nr:tetratricopeptide repeat protein [bacterium]